MGRCRGFAEGFGFKSWICIGFKVWGGVELDTTAFASLGSQRFGLKPWNPELQGLRREVSDLGFVCRPQQVPIFFGA